MSTKYTARFVDGPLKDQMCTPPVLPIMLRGTLSKGKVGFLYDNDASPSDGLFVYIMTGDPSTGFWDGRDPATKKRVGGMMMFAKYRLLDPQPSADAVVSDGAWKQWCAENEVWLRALYESSLPPRKPKKFRPRSEGAEPDYGGVFGADGQVHSDADPGL